MSDVEERDFLLASLRDLDAERAAGDIDDDDYQRLRDSYTARAAAVIRVLGTESGAIAPDSVPKSPKRRLRALAAGLVVAVCAGGAGFAVAEMSGRRSATDEATGSLPEGSVDRITKAQALVSEGDILGAVKVYDSLLDDDPENPVALAERGWLLSRVDPTLVDSGLASIERAIAIDPNYPEAHFFRGMILWKSKGDPAAGAVEIQKALDAGPPPALVPVLERTRDEAKAASP